MSDFIKGKSKCSIELMEYFIERFGTIGFVHLHHTKSMIGISNSDKRIAWITHLGKDFVHIVFPFEKPYPDNLCFLKIAQVPGDDAQFNHHIRIYSKDDINEEVMGFMRIAYGQ